MSLIKIFGNEVIGEGFVEFFDIFEGIMLISVRYVVRFELIVEDLFNVF